MRTLTEYTALLALPNGEMARDAASRLVGADSVSVTDEENIGVWVVWTVNADSDTDGIHALQEIRLRAEMGAEFAQADATTESGDRPTLFQATPLIILRGAASVIHSEEVYCI